MTTFKNSLWQIISHKWTNKLYWITKIQKLKTKIKKKRHINLKTISKKKPKKKENKKWILKER